MSFVGGLLRAPGTQGQDVRLNFDTAASRNLVLGRAVVGGVFNWHGLTSFDRGDNRDLHRVIILAGHRVNRMRGLWVDGVRIANTVFPHGQRTIIPEFNDGDDDRNRLWVTFYDGRPNQSADGFLSSVGAQPFRWRSTDRVSGCAYMVVTMRHDNDVLRRELRLKAEIEGAYLYDRRRDSTAGGFGSQRYDNPSSWAYTDNAAVAVDHYCLGIVGGQNNDQIIFGMNQDPSWQKPYGEFTENADLSDEIVNGVSRYAANGILSAADDHVHNLGLLARQMAARVYDEGGRIRIRPIQARAISLTLTDDDLVGGTPFGLVDNPGSADLVNTIRGDFLDPNSDFAKVPLPIQQDDELISQDGRPFENTLDLPLEINPNRGQRILSLELERQKRRDVISETFMPIARVLEAGDWIERVTNLRGAVTKIYEVEEISRNRDGTVDITARETDPSITAFGPDQARPVALPEPPEPIERRNPDPPESTGEGQPFVGGGAELPVGRITLTPPEGESFESVEYFEFEYGPSNGLAGEDLGIIEGQALFVSFANDGNLSFFLPNVLPSTVYAYRVRTRAGLRVTAYGPFLEFLTTAGLIATNTAMLGDRTAEEIIQAADAAIDQSGLDAAIAGVDAAQSQAIADVEAALTLADELLREDLEASLNTARDELAEVDGLIQEALEDVDQARISGDADILVVTDELRSDVDGNAFAIDQTRLITDDLAAVTQTISTGAAGDGVVPINRTGSFYTTVLQGHPSQLPTLQQSGPASLLLAGDDYRIRISSSTFLRPIKYIAIDVGDVIRARYNVSCQIVDGSGWIRPALRLSDENYESIDRRNIRTVFLADGETRTVYIDDYTVTQADIDAGARFISTDCRHNRESASNITSDIFIHSPVFFEKVTQQAEINSIRAVQDGLAISFDELSVGVADNVVALTQEAVLRNEGDNALGALFTTLSLSVDENTSDIAEERLVREGLAAEISRLRVSSGVLDRIIPFDGNGELWVSGPRESGPSSSISNYPDSIEFVENEEGSQWISDGSSSPAYLRSTLPVDPNNPKAYRLTLDYWVDRFDSNNPDNTRVRALAFALDSDFRDASASGASIAIAESSPSGNDVSGEWLQFVWEFSDGDTDLIGNGEFLGGNSNFDRDRTRWIKILLSLNFSNGNGRMKARRFQINEITSAVRAAAEIEAERQARIDEQAALAVITEGLRTDVDGNLAITSSELLALSDANSVLVGQIEQANVLIDQAAAERLSESVLRADADSALSATLSTQAASIGQNASNISQNSSVLANARGSFANLESRLNAGDITASTALSVASEAGDEVAVISSQLESAEGSINETSLLTTSLAGFLAQHSLLLRDSAGNVTGVVNRLESDGSTSVSTLSIFADIIRLANGLAAFEISENRLRLKGDLEIVAANKTLVLQADAPASGPHSWVIWLGNTSIAPASRTLLNADLYWDVNSNISLPASTLLDGSTLVSSQPFATGTTESNSRTASIDADLGTLPAGSVLLEVSYSFNNETFTSVDNGLQFRNISTTIVFERSTNGGSSFTAFATRQINGNSFFFGVGETGGQITITDNISGGLSVTNSHSAGDITYRARMTGRGGENGGNQSLTLKATRN